MKKALSLMLASILLIGILAACGTGEDKAQNGGEGKSEKKVLVVGTSADYPPFEYVDTANNDEIIGFDIELVKTLANELGYDVQVKDMDFSGLISAIKSEQVDLVISGMTPTEDRKKNVDFSDIYYTANHMIVSKKDSGIESIEELKGKTVGVQLGSIQEEQAEEIAKTVDIKVENRNRIPEIVQEVLSGRFDAAIIEDTVANGYFKRNKDLIGFSLPQSEEAGSAIAFPKGSELTEKFNQELKKMKENGVIDKLIVKWFDGE